MRLNKPSAHAAASLLFVSLGWLPAVNADDTELFVTGFDAPASCEAPNVLFLIDTSRSMSSEVLTQVTWDPDENFEGCYDSGALYYSATGDLPECTSELRFAKNLNACAAGDDRLRLVGRYKNLFRSWDAERERWEVLDPLDNDGPVECEADSGVDGNRSASQPFAADGADGPWSANDSSEPAWASASNVTVFDGNWLNWNSNPPTLTRTRLEVVQEVTNSIIESLENVNVGVMRFNSNEGGPVIHALEPVETSRESAQQTVNDLTADSFTPLSETLYEAQQYLAQRNVDYGNVGPILSVPETRVGGAPGSPTYLSPLVANGQKSFIVILTDGEPTEDSSADTKITQLPGFAQLVGQDCDGVDDGRCLDDLAEYLFKADLRDTIPGQQNVITHAIGFTLGLDLLESTAARGGGRYFETTDTASLTAALTELAESFEEEGGLFAAPTVAVNAFNRTSTLNDVFLSVFEPSETLRWIGNVKKYRLAVETTNDPDAPVDVFLEDRDGRLAVDPATGFFAQSARSFWSDAPDGNQTRLGGAAGRLPDPDSRRVYTNISGGDLNSPSAQNQLTVANGLIAAADLGAPTADRDAVIEWLRGRDVLDEDGDEDATEARRDLGDPLHSRPAAVIYGGTEQDPDTTVYVGTNDGLLHAIDARTGDELWAFLPERLLGRQFALYTNNRSATRSYGLDGEITVYIQNSDGQPGIGAGERVLLLFGMRRGGEAVFALDVTNRNRPRVAWEIDSGQAGFGDLGQTWSTPRVARVNISGNPREVVLFAGGYDTGQDNRVFREDSVGNAVFMVDLNTGALIWSAGESNDHDLRLPRMRFSIPAAPALLDLNEDGLVDRLFFGDMGGQVWRLDVRNGLTAGNLVEGGVLASLGAADLGAAAPASEIRRFFATPDVVPVASNGRLYLSVNIGSGYRAHPLDTAADEQFFSVRDLRAFADLTSADYDNPLTVDQLTDVTNDVNAVLDPLAAGWRLRLVQGAGEKVLSESVTFANTVFFTSFQPNNPANACTPASGINRVYQVSVVNGRPLTNLDNSVGDPALTDTDRFVTLRQGGIAPRPVFLFPAELPPGQGPVVLSGAERIPNDPTGSIIRSFWLQREQP